jgi:hypothetical protein
LAKNREKSQKSIGSWQKMIGNWQFFTGKNVNTRVFD